MRHSRREDVLTRSLARARFHACPVLGESITPEPRTTSSSEASPDRRSRWTTRQRALVPVGRTVARFEIKCHGWCYLPNHSHLLITSQLGNLSRAMHWLGMRTAQTFNRRYERAGHLYQGRFGSRLIADDNYFLELGRYLPLNPVRAGLCIDPADWPWSSYAATVGLEGSSVVPRRAPLVDGRGSSTNYVAWVAEGLETNPLDDLGVPLPRRVPCWRRSCPKARIAALRSRTTSTDTRRLRSRSISVSAILKLAVGRRGAAESVPGAGMGLQTREVRVRPLFIPRVVEFWQLRKAGAKTC